MQLKCIIVDDESLSRMALEKLCEKVPDLEVVGICENGTEAITMLQSETVDLLFLDIHMPDLTGMDLVRSIRPLPQIVFTTTDKGYALEAFEYNVTDYLLKPVTLPRLLQAVHKARQKITPPPSDATPDTTTGQFFIRVDNRLVNISLDDLWWIEAKGDYILFHTTEKRHIVHMTMKTAESRLPAGRFQKVHRQYIVNLSKIVDIEDNSILIGDKVIPISRSQREPLMKKAQFAINNSFSEITSLDRLP